MIVIIGAGIAGLSLGYELTKAGADVTIVEANRVAGGASGVATCYLEPRLGDTPMRRLERDALTQWPLLVAQLEAATGMDLGFRTAGQLRVSLPDHVEKLQLNTAQREAEGSPFERLDPAEVRKREPLISSAIAEAVFLPHVRWVDGTKVCAALASAIRTLGGTIAEGRAAASIHADRVELADGGAIGACKIVLANGMGANAVEGRPGDIPTARPVRGVNLVLDMSGLQKPVRHMIKHHRGNLVPADDRRLIVGTTYEAGVESLQVAQDVVEKLYTNAEPILPFVRDLPLLEINAGLRTKVADGNLRIGQSLEAPHVFYSLGHAGSGYLRAPVVAPEFARFVLSGKPGPMIERIVAG